MSGFGEGGTPVFARLFVEIAPGFMSFFFVEERAVIHLNLPESDWSSIASPRHQEGGVRVNFGGGMLFYGLDPAIAEHRRIFVQFQSYGVVAIVCYLHLCFLTTSCYSQLFVSYPTPNFPIFLVSWKLPLSREPPTPESS